MPTNTTSADLEEDFDEDDFSTDDYVFIVGPDGKLKTLIIPENLMEDPPTEISAILELFQIEDIHDLGNQTLQ